MTVTTEVKHNVFSNDIILKEIRSALMPKQQFKSISQDFRKELTQMLNKSSDSMLPSSLNILRLYKDNNDLLHPYNHNKILAIDFGGTTLKIAVIKTYPTLCIDYLHTLNIQERYVDSLFFEKIIQAMIDEMKDKFFDFFYDNDLIDNKILNIPVSITFSFPLNSKFEITSMGKGYTLSDEIKNINFLTFLQKTFNKVCSQNSIKDTFAFTIKDNLIINDSIAVHLTNTYIKQFPTVTFFTDSYPSIPASSSSTLANSHGNSISFILGTGTNSSFELPFKRLPEFKRLELMKTKNNAPFEDDTTVVINAEMGFLGESCITLTQFDYLPPGSAKPMPLEYISSGRYIPSILINILNKYPALEPTLAGMTELDKIIDGAVFGKLANIQDNFDLDELTSQLQNKHGIKTPLHLLPLSRVAKIIVQRASIYLVAALLEIDSLVSEHKVSPYHKISIGYVGSTLAYSKYYQDQIEKVSNGRINLVLLQDSSLFGAAISTLL
ncbi:similar to Saccharomyces cerevisiae YLR446W Putative protein of unknown function with similarity to hexokinases [Maudiozyma saulgeensis]|uniref:Phosphotransferase n=1 Tax=Maudiozyma saulgeensis TaxID=1789683 RepID=A0A1X7R8K8_9SACH|nr:similar to Saccharomyces cerevisiae YLR446W Putative protein of unknown function with similarity to hexokinases [Kazachstania saulgeensis]